MELAPASSKGVGTMRSCRLVMRAVGRLFSQWLSPSLLSHARTGADVESFDQLRSVLAEQRRQKESFTSAYAVLGQWLLGKNMQSWQTCVRWQVEVWQCGSRCYHPHIWCIALFLFSRGSRLGVGRWRWEDLLLTLPSIFHCCTLDIPVWINECSKPCRMKASHSHLATNQVS